MPETKTKIEPETETEDELEAKVKIESASKTKDEPETKTINSVRKVKDSEEREYFQVEFSYHIPLHIALVELVDVTGSDDQSLKFQGKKISDLQRECLDVKHIF